MTITLRIVVALASILTAYMVLKKIQHSKMVIEDSLFWIFFCGVLIVFALFPAVPKFLSMIAGTMTTANFVYMAIIFLLIVKLFHVSVKMSELETKIRNLTHELALYEKANERTNGDGCNGSK